MSWVHIEKDFRHAYFNHLILLWYKIFSNLEQGAWRLDCSMLPDDESIIFFSIQILLSKPVKTLNLSGKRNHIITIFQNIRSMGQKKSFSASRLPHAQFHENQIPGENCRVSSLHWSRGSRQSCLKKIRLIFFYLFKKMFSNSTTLKGTWKGLEGNFDGTFKNEIET